MTPSRPEQARLPHSKTANPPPSQRCGTLGNFFSGLLEPLSRRLFCALLDIRVGLCPDLGEGRGVDIAGAAGERRRDRRPGRYYRVMMEVPANGRGSAAGGGPLASQIADTSNSERFRSAPRTD